MCSSVFIILRVLLLERTGTYLKRRFGETFSEAGTRVLEMEQRLSTLVQLGSLSSYWSLLLAPLQTSPSPCLTEEHQKNTPEMD